MQDDTTNTTKNPEDWDDALQHLCRIDPAVLAISEALETFPRFSEFPAEIRLMIWNAALPGTTRVPRDWNETKLHYYLRRRVPAVLQACYESRTALAGVPGDSHPDKYELVDIRGTLFSINRIYINWLKDEVWIRDGWDVRQCEFVALRNLRALAMDWGVHPWLSGDNLFRGVNFVRKFPRLERLTLLVHFAEKMAGLTTRAIRKQTRKEYRAIRGQAKVVFDVVQSLEPGWVPPRLLLEPTFGSRWHYSSVGQDSWLDWE